MTDDSTHNLCMWLDNDYTIYHACKRWAKRQTEITPDTAKEFILSIYPLGTPDMLDEYGRPFRKTRSMSVVDWFYIAGHLKQLAR